LEYRIIPRYDIVKRVNFLKLLASVLLCQFAGAIGSIFTAPSVENCYLFLEKPSFTPPSWIFFPVWVMLIHYGNLIYLVWEKGLKEQEIKMGLLIFGIQLGLNVLWSFLFFGLKSPYYAFVEIILLWLVIFMTILKFRISKNSFLSTISLYPVG
jgi:tryptophan-rich sensory protein